MPVPKRKRSKRRRDQRFANKGMKVKAISKCAQCTAPIATHVACKECGYYKGVKVLSTKSDRTLKRKETLAAKQPAQQASQEPTE